MSVLIHLPYNSKFEFEVSVNADFIQVCTIVDPKTSQVYGPFSGQGQRTIGKFILTIPPGTNPAGYALRVIIFHHVGSSGQMKENDYVIEPLGGTLYMVVRTEDLLGTPDTDWNDCTLAIRKA